MAKDQIGQNQVESVEETWDITIEDWEGRHEVSFTRADVLSLMRQLKTPAAPGWPVGPSVVLLKGVAIENRYGWSLAQAGIDYFGITRAEAVKAGVYAHVND